MKTDRIDFISSYCDRWCERCTYTDRCSAFACEVAAGMCGDLAAGIELAIGTPHPVETAPRETAGARAMAEYLDRQPSAEELAQFERDDRARRARLARHPMSALATACTLRSTTWLEKRRDEIAAAGDPVVREALAIVAWDAYFIGAKLHRALSGRDRRQHGERESDDSPVQNDWNGSAKLALISLERCEAAWRVIADATGDREASALADAAGALRRTVLEEFPNAMSFVRPGFDEPWRD